MKVNHQGTGFILTRRQVDVSGQQLLEYWLTTDDGPIRVCTAAQSTVVFVAQEDTSSIKQYLQQQNVRFELKPLALQTFEREPVAGLYFHSGYAAFQARDLLSKKGVTLYESDIRLSDRYLMERFVYANAAFSGEKGESSDNTYLSLNNGQLTNAEYSPELTWLSVDIECSESGELFSIGLSSGDFNNVIMIGPSEQGAEKYITWVDDEAALLTEFCNAVRAFDPDILIGWNVINFDFRTLVEAAQRTKCSLNLGRDGSAIGWRVDKSDAQQGYVTIAGRVVLDGIDGLKTATYQFESFSLDYVANALLGEGKDTDDVDNRLAKIEHDFIHNKKRLAAYNLQDCKLVEGIFEKTNLLDFLVLRSQLTGLELDRKGGSVAAFLNLYLPKLHRAGYVSPNRPKDGGLASPGGYVMNSRPGLYNHVLVLDFKSLYPSIIRTFKIDPVGLQEGLLDEESAIPGFKGACFHRQKHFLPDIITSLWKQRDEAKRQKDSARSQAIKILMNSFYGVLGSGGCPLYDTRLASSITMRGHDIMQTTAKWIEQEGYKVIYGDTDSTFVWLEHAQSNEKAREIGKRLEILINENWHAKLRDEFDLECFLEIEFETHFETFLMPTIRGSDVGSKKRYAGIKVDGQHRELVFKGLETVRSDWTELAKEFQQTLYQMVFDQQDVAQYIRDIIYQTRSGQRDDQLVYKKRLRQRLEKYVKNVPPHVRAARNADDINERLGNDLRYQRKGWISYVITTSGPQAVEHASSPLDYDHYIDKQIRPIAEGILPFVDLSFDRIVSNQMELFN